jgi:hypothetical protein
VADPSIPTRPMPTSSEERDRWEHTDLRMRMLRGEWEQDLDRRLQRMIDPARYSAWGGRYATDLSSNVFKSVVTQLACLYDRTPTLSHDTNADGLIGPGGAMARSGVWSLMQRVAQMVIGSREYLVRVSFTEEHGLRYRPIRPSLVSAAADPERPEQPTYLREARLRKHPERDDWIWTWEILDVSNPEAPQYRIAESTTTGEGADLTAAYLGVESLSGDAYPYRRRDGRPVLPVVLYHAENTGHLWDPYTWSEVVEGSLTAALLFSFFTHAMRQASWPQRYGVNIRVPGAETVDVEGAGRRQRLPTDPASLLLLESDGDVQPMIGQFGPGADVDTLLSSIMSYETRVASWAGVSASDVHRSGAARSGYAIAISNEGKRAAARRFEPQFRDGDTRLAMLSAILLNRAKGTNFPEGGYRIRYESVPESAEEKKGEREHILGLLDSGLMDMASAYQTLNPGTSRADAEAALEQIRITNIRYRGTQAV